MKTRALDNFAEPMERRIELTLEERTIFLEKAKKEVEKKYKVFIDYTIHDTENAFFGYVERIHLKITYPKNMYCVFCLDYMLDPMLYERVIIERIEGAWLEFLRRGYRSE